MKLLLLVISLFNILTLSNTYKTKEEEFECIIHDAYEEYVYLENKITVGDLIVVVGRVDENISFSIYFKNISYPKYQVKVIKENSSVKEYVLSNYDDYQIYYNIEVKKNTKYYVELINEESKIVYNRYEVISNKSMDQFDQSLIIKGEGTNNFPYKTKLSTKLSFFQKVGIIIGIIIIVEIIIVSIVLIKKKKKKNQQFNHYNDQILDENIFDNNDYEIKDRDNES